MMMKSTSQYHKMMWTGIAISLSVIGFLAWTSDKGVKRVRHSSETHDDVIMEMEDIGPQQSKETSQEEIFWLMALPQSGGIEVVEAIRSSAVKGHMQFASNDLAAVHSPNNYRPALSDSYKVGNITIGPWILHPDSDIASDSSLVHTNCLTGPSIEDSQFDCRRTPVLVNGEIFPSIYRHEISKAILTTRNPIEHAIALFRNEHYLQRRESLHKREDLLEWCEDAPDAKIPCQSLFAGMLNWYQHALEQNMPVLVQYAEAMDLFKVQEFLGLDQREGSACKFPEYTGYFTNDEKTRIKVWLYEQANLAIQEQILAPYFDPKPSAG